MARVRRGSRALAVRRRWWAAVAPVAIVAPLLVLTAANSDRSTPTPRAATSSAATVRPRLVHEPAASASPALVRDPAAWVDPLIGTSGTVNDFPGADVPFGMVQWSPDTTSRPPGGGYEYHDNRVAGFSLTHISGPGCASAGDVPVLPLSGAIPRDPDRATLPLDHSQETAAAGYYRLRANRITTQLATTTRSGIAQFAFPAGRQANLLLKLSDSAAGTSATHLQVVSPTEVSGSVTSGHFCSSRDVYTMYFDFVFDRPFTHTGTWTNSSDVDPGTTSVTAHGASGMPATTPTARSSNGVRRPAPRLHGILAIPGVRRSVTGADGAYLSFDGSRGAALRAKVGISYVSAANAVANRVAEDPGWNFTAVRAASHRAWNDVLGKVLVGGGTTRDRRVFYTALYHSLLHPNVFSDVNGQYIGPDDRVYRAARGHAEYANYSGWDIYRTQAQLEALVAPRQASDSARSVLDFYRHSGQMPKWTLNNGESYVMVGDPAAAILADYYAFGARDFDAKAALRALVAEANRVNHIRPGGGYYREFGYIPYDGIFSCCNFYGAVATQEEYNAADTGIARLAAALGYRATAATFAARANNWQNVFNPASGFLQPKYANGRFLGGFRPDAKTGFVEGNSYRYTAMETQNVAGLIAAAGGRQQWAKRLDMLSSDVARPGAQNADFGNEPSIEIPWEYDYVGQPWKTQRVVREVQQKLFPPAPAGIAGNDDLGAMSAWYVFSALGFYPEIPGSAMLALGSPVFAKAVLRLPTGKILTVLGHGAAAKAPYVQRLSVNGAAYNKAYLPAATVANGGTLAFALGTRPDTAWGTAPNAAPPSDVTGGYPALGYVQAPTVPVQPRRRVAVKLGIRPLLESPQAISFSAASAPGGPKVSPSSGTLHVAAGTDATRELTLVAPAREGRYLVTVGLHGAGGRALPKVVLELKVGSAGALWPYFNNAAISRDGSHFQADYDGNTNSFSAQQLAAAGWRPGTTRTVDGLTYTFPNTAPGDEDNVEARGQRILLQPHRGARRLGVLGSATNAAAGCRATLSVTYTDNTTSTVRLGMPDWTGRRPPAPNTAIAAKLPYRNTARGGSRPITTYLFTATGPIDSRKTVKSVTLPSAVSRGQLHLFAIAAS